MGSAASSRLSPRFAEPRTRSVHTPCTIVSPGTVRAGLNFALLSRSLAMSLKKAFPPATEIKTLDSAYFTQATF